MTEAPHDDQDIANLLSELGRQTPQYPAELLAKRRAAYQNSLAGLGLGLAAAGAAQGGLLSLLASSPTAVMAVTAALVLGTLAGIAYFGSGNIERNRVGPGSTTSSTPLSAGSRHTVTSTASASASPTGTGTSTATASATPTATGSLTSTPSFFGTPTPSLSATSTPSNSLTPGPRPTDKGRHLGQTPTPPGKRETPPGPRGTQGSEREP